MVIYISEWGGEGSVDELGRPDGFVVALCNSSEDQEEIGWFSTLKEAYEYAKTVKKVLFGAGLKIIEIRCSALPEGFNTKEEWESGFMNELSN